MGESISEKVMGKVKTRSTIKEVELDSAQKGLQVTNYKIIR